MATVSTFDLAFLTSVGLMILSIIGIMFKVTRLGAHDAHETST